MAEMKQKVQQLDAEGMEDFRIARKLGITVHEVLFHLGFSRPLNEWVRIFRSDGLTLEECSAILGKPAAVLSKFYLADDDDREAWLTSNTSGELLAEVVEAPETPEPVVKAVVDPPTPRHVKRFNGLCQKPGFRRLSPIGKAIFLYDRLKFTKAEIVEVAGLPSAQVFGLFNPQSKKYWKRHEGKSN